MALTEEQIKQIKDQLSRQISHLPQDQRAEANRQISAMTPESLELLLEEERSKKNTNIKEQKTVFRMIVDKELDSALVEENKFAIAVLDINPISQGHIIIIPKKPSKDIKSLPSQVLSFAKKIANMLEKKLKAKSVDLYTELKFEEIIINVLPSYDSKVNLNSPRKTIPIESLKELAYKLSNKKKKLPLIRKKTSKESSKTIKLNRRIP